MSSLFSFLRERDETADTTPPAAPNFASLAATDEGSLQIYHGKPAQEVILTAIRKELEVFIHANEYPFPDPNFSFTRIQEKPTGLGNRIGQEQLSHFAFALKGNRLEAGVRFQLWGDSRPPSIRQLILYTANCSQPKKACGQKGFYALQPISHRCLNMYPPFLPGGVRPFTIFCTNSIM